MPASVTLIPEKECPTRTAGPSCRASTRSAEATASGRVVSGFCTDVALSPAACNRAITSDQDDPSANSPCTRTMFLAIGAGWAAAAVPWTRVLAAPAATMLTNARRFIGYLGRRSSWLFMEGFPLPEIEVSHVKGSIWLRRAWRALLSRAAPRMHLPKRALAHTGQGLLLLSPHIGFDRHKNERTRPPNSCGGTRNCCQLGLA